MKIINRWLVGPMEKIYKLEGEEEEVTDEAAKKEEADETTDSAE